jgi:hypothetical protein
MIMKIKILKIRWGLSSKMMFKKPYNVFIYTYSDLDTNKVINQKYFYSDNDSSKEEKQEVTLIKTKQKIKIKKKEKEKLIKYLKEKEINIEYFEKFEGYINLVMVEWFDKKQNIYIKNIYIYFYNLLLKIKTGRILILNILKKEDIEIIAILLTNYISDFEKNILNNNYFNFSFFKKLNSNVFINKKLGYNCQELLIYFLKYKELLIYLHTKLLVNEVDSKDFLCLQVKEGMEMSKYEKSFNNDKNVYELYKKNKEFFDKFNGSVFLMEFDINVIENKKKIKKKVLIFLNESNWKWRVFYLSDIYNLNFALILLKMQWFEDNYLFDETQRNMIRNFVRTNTSLYKNDDEYFVNIRNSKIIVLKNKEELIYHIEYYKLFL